MTAPLSADAPASAVVPPVRRPYAAVFRALIASAALTGLVLDLVQGSPGRVLGYFTVQSNILAAAVLAVSAWRAWSGRPPLPPLVTGGTVLFLSVTGLFHHLLLPGGLPMTAPLSGGQPVSDHLLHTATPLGAVLDLLLLTRPGALRPRDAGLWMLYPLAYLAFALARGATLAPGPGSRYPYPFLDVDTHGYGGVLGNAGIVGLIILALALALVGLDQVRPYVRGSDNRISPERASGLK
ncbi:Pr6Pr family membrane protein [Streptomyces sp. SP18CS02]|uniref:Pr6Pr family membrane protein n=1 Tax=Streptomyces sp. SP18CS02 TaxID=3002531 RepID=UPI002E79CE4E|nr:Pr6Pr family membrane protein [Streptomyces sp. SP18CS02]MEE1756793.1 Pr6Pr family membrane protein [Streptomyces sp. SP18CS02]